MGDRPVESSETPSTKDEGFISRLKLVIEEYGSINSLAKAANLSESSIRKWRDGTSEPSRDRLVALAEAAQVSMDWLAAGKGPIRQSYLFEGRDNTSNSSEDGSSFTLVKNPFSQPSEVAKRQIQLQLLQGLEGYYTRVVDNQNMEPTLYPGDLCIFDKKIVEPNDLEEGIYAIVLNGTVVIRRLQHMLDNHILAVNDNPNYNASNIVINLSNQSQSFSILGKLIYFCRAAS